MKRIVVFVFVLLMMPLNSVLAKTVQVADVGAEDLMTVIHSISNNSEMQTLLPLKITDVRRTKDLDKPSQGLYCWKCQFGDKNYKNFDGEIQFLVNGGGCVSKIKVVQYKNANPYLVSGALTTVLYSLGLDDEIRVLFTVYDDSSSQRVSNAWSRPKNRRFILTSYGTVNVVDATDD
ncbi:MAG: hypothetical protein IJ563_04625 [Selenomonadaceae bacterium]|nr:hypothetical protein [Selenomonadaceae bacterium]